VVAPVLSQPSLPLPIGPGARRRRAAIDAAPEEVDRARRRLDEEDLTLLALRFCGDAFVPDERFERLKQCFGARLETIELPAEAAAPGTGMAPHSVLTIHLDDSQPDGPTRRAERRVIEFFVSRLRR
jgi:hypothetical protein